MKQAGKDVSKYNRAELMKAEYDSTPLAIESRRTHPDLPG